jgi:hypothetical protein
MTGGPGPGSPIQLASNQTYLTNCLESGTRLPGNAVVWQGDTRGRLHASALLKEIHAGRKL